MERIAAEPVGELNVYVVVGLPMVLVLLAWIQQHVGIAGNRNRCLDCIFPLLKLGPGQVPRVVANAVLGSVSKANSAAW